MCQFISNVESMCEQVIHESNKSMIYVYTKHPGRLFINVALGGTVSTEDRNRCPSTERHIYAVCNQKLICGLIKSFIRLKFF